MNIILLVLLLFVSITFHEYSHGYVANLLGDPTPKSSGRLTFNPLAHIDIFGTLILPILLLALSQGNFSFGYAKPVPINPYHFKNPKRDMFLVGLAGPAINVLLAALFAVILKLSNYSFLPGIIVEGVIINVILAVFNLIPIPPLDGSRILSAVLPYRISYSYLRMETFGSVIIIFMIAFGVFRWLISPMVNCILSLLRIKVVV